MVNWNFVLSLSGTLLAELREYNLEQQRRAQADSHSPDAPPEDSSISGRLKGKMTSRLASYDPGCPVTLGCQTHNSKSLGFQKGLADLTLFELVWSSTALYNDSVCFDMKCSKTTIFLYLVCNCWLGHRFDGSESVVIVAAQKRTLGGRELQLPCMSSLTSKTSTQKFFLRVLQVIIQLREDTRRANKKAKQTGRLGKMLLQYSWCIHPLSWRSTEWYKPSPPSVNVQAPPVWAQPAASRLLCVSSRLKLMPSSRWWERVSGHAASNRPPYPPPPLPLQPLSPPDPQWQPPMLPLVLLPLLARLLLPRLAWLHWQQAYSYLHTAHTYIRRQCNRKKEHCLHSIPITELLWWSSRFNAMKWLTATDMQHI